MGHRFAMSTACVSVLAVITACGTDTPTEQTNEWPGNQGPAYARHAPAAPNTPVLSLVPIAIPNPPTVTGTYSVHCRAVIDGHNKTLPDPTCTPGSVNPAVTEASIGATVCTPGWTKTVRPPASDTDRVKTKAMRAYGESASDRHTTELDHLVPLELGGSDDVGNLWPEPSDLPNAGTRNSKDQVENQLKAAVCAHRVDLNAAREAIATDWVTAEQRLGLTR